MWPRHTGDFSVFRVYANEENLPADYSVYNKPYQPRFVAPVSLEGYKPEDFTMIMGYPGRTNRYLSSWGIQQRLYSSNEPRIEVRGIKQDIWKSMMEQDDATRIKYSSKYQSSSNYWKNSIGMNRGVEKMNVIPRKQQLEADFAAWLDKNPSKKATYGDALSMIKEGYQSTDQETKYFTYISEAGFGAEAVSYALMIQHFALSDWSEDANAFFEDAYKDYVPELDEQVLAAMLSILKKRLPNEYSDIILKDIDKKYKGDYVKYAADVFEKSVIPYPEKGKELLQNPKKKAKINEDPIVVLAKKISSISSQVYEKMAENKENIQKGERLFLAGLMEMMPEKDFYPDANLTLRLTYGTVGGYIPYDGAWYDYYTTPKGIFEKYKKDDYEFHVQPEILALLQSGDFGRYGNADGTMNVNFLSSNDITGGNSGSAIFDGKGRLLGLAFDGNWEAMSGDIAFEPEVQRTINVDVRYMLFMIDKWGKAQHLIKELYLD
jgi:Peptidase S46.